MPDYPIGYEPIGTVALLTNPHSGYGSARHATERALEQFSRRGVEAVAFTGHSKEDTSRLLCEAVNDMDFDALVIVGGDGMLNVALQETAQTGMPVGIIPSGSGNDLARYFQIPFDPARAAQVIADGFVTTTDLGKVADEEGNESWFSTILSCGLDAHIAHRGAEVKWAKGPHKFTVAIAESLANLRSFHFRLEIEGAEEIPYLSKNAHSRNLRTYGPIADDGTITIDRELIVVAFGNTRNSGGGRIACPHANHRDGLLDLTMMEPARASDYALNLKAVSEGAHDELPFVTSLRLKKARVTSDVGIPSFGDGEGLLSYPLTVTAEPAAARYIVPAP